MHRSAQRLRTCRWCERERPSSTTHCPACGPPIVVRMIHDGLFGGLGAVPGAIVAWLGLWFGKLLDSELQQLVYASLGETDRAAAFARETKIIWWVGEQPDAVEGVMS